MPVKKLPPRLPLDSFKSTSAGGYQADLLDNENRTTPLMVIDPHVFLPYTDQPDLIESSFESWKKSIQQLHSPSPTQPTPHHPSFQGCVYLHHQPPWLPRPPSPPHGSTHYQLSDDWLKEQEKIIKIDRELAKIQMGKPLAQVIWAPLYEGEQVLEKYLKEIDEQKINIKISGCCHLIRSNSTIDPKKNDALHPNFVSSLKFLGRIGLTVELFVESNMDRSATSVLDDVLESVSAVRLDQDPQHQTKFILCQMGMPEMISSQSKIPSSVSCSSILSRLFSLSLFSNFEIKLTSLPIIPDEDLNGQLIERFKSKYLNQSNPLTTTTVASKMVVEDQDQVADDVQDNHNDDTNANQATKSNLAKSESAWKEMKKRIKFYLEPILEAFGDHRVIYSSGFPYFDSANQGISPAIPNAVLRYQYQFEILRECLTEFGLKNHALDNVFGLNAQFSSLFFCFSFSHRSFVPSPFPIVFIIFICFVWERNADFFFQHLLLSDDKINRGCYGI